MSVDGSGVWSCILAWHARAWCVFCYAVRKQKGKRRTQREEEKSVFRTGAVSAPREVSQCFHTSLPIFADPLAGGFQQGLDIGNSELR